MLKKYLLFFISLIIVALGQPSTCNWLGIIAALGGYGLFWFSQSKRSFLTPFSWFTAVQLFQLSWMTSWEYVGPYISIIYVFLSLAMGAQFAWLSSYIKFDRPLSWARILALSSLWTILEWSRLFFICGFTWNPAGLGLSCHDFSRQWANIGGVYWLSFWVMFVNLLFYNCLKFKVQWSRWIFCAALPFLFGGAFTFWHDIQQHKDSKFYHVALVQTALLPEEKVPYFGDRQKKCYLPVQQWQRILQLLKKHDKKKLDLIVLPESVVPYGCVKPITAYDDVKKSFEKIFNCQSKNFFPAINSSLVQWYKEDNEEFLAVGNAFWAQALANYFNCEVIAGLEDFELANTHEKHISYQAAFHFIAHKTSLERYEKQVLVPMAEYIPFEWCKQIAAKWGIIYFFTPGTMAKVFEGKLKLGTTICYEETFANLVRQNRVNGAELLVNVTNDVWYPNSSLPWQHFELGKLRAVENGIPLVRACNNGITAGIDAFGRKIKILGEEEGNEEWLADSICIDVPIYHYSTFYSYVGDYFVISLSFIFLIYKGLLSLLSRRKVLAHNAKRH